MPGGIYTLADYAQVLKDDVERQFLTDLLEGEDWLTRFPVREVQGLQAAVRIRVAMPQVGERRLNEPFPEITKGERRIQTFSLVEIGGVLPIDIAYRDIPESALDFDPVREDLDDLMRSMRWKLRDLIFNGSRVQNEKLFDGIKTWVRDPANAEQTVDAAGLDISPSADDLQTNLQQFMDLLDDAIDRLDGSDGDAIFVSRATFLRIQSITRRVPNLFPFGENKLELRVPSYHGMPFIRVGYRPGAKRIADPQIIADSNESGSGTGTDVYVVKFGTKGAHGVRLLSRGGPKLEELGRDSTEGVTYRWLARWPVGLEIAGMRPIARVRNVKVV